MIAGIAILMTGIVALVWQLGSEINADRKLSQEIRELRSKLADKSRRDGLELQKECGLQGAKIFSQWGWKLDEPTNGSIADFESHYNPVLNKCFVTCIQ